MACSWQNVKASLDDFREYTTVEGVITGCDSNAIKMIFDNYPSTTPELVPVDDQGNFKYRVKNLPVSCGSQLKVTLKCDGSHSESCTLDTTLIVECNKICPTSAEIKVYRGERLLTPIDLRTDVLDYAKYTFRIEVSPRLEENSEIILSIRVDDIELLELTDPRISNLAPDKSSFDFDFQSPLFSVEAIATVLTIDEAGSRCPVLQSTETIRGLGYFIPSEKPAPDKPDKDEVIIPPPAPPELPGKEDYAGCSFKCVLLGIFMLMPAVSFHVFSAAIFDMLALALASAAATASIAFFLDECGECCLWKFILSGLIAAGVAVVVAAVITGTIPEPSRVGMVVSLVGGYIVMAEAFRRLCNKRKRERPSPGAV